MKKVFLFVLMLGTVLQGYSQIVLREAKVVYVPEKMKVDPIKNSLTLEVNEKFAGEFQEDALEFLRKNFDPVKLAADNRDKKFDRYEVTFKSDKGLLMASFDRDGNLISSFQKFKGVGLPPEVRSDLYARYGKTELLKTKYIATSKSWNLDGEFYRLKIRSANGVDRLKMYKKAGQSRFASM